MTDQTDLEAGQAPDMELSTDSMEALLGDIVNGGIDNLTEEQQGMLSKVLFPDTHNTKVTVKGTERELRPMPIKFARRIHAAMLPFNKAAVKGMQQESAFELDEHLLKALFGTAKVMAEFYGWEDVTEAVEEEDLLMEELQGLTVTQQNLQGENDFLLGPSRVATKIMQAREVTNVRLLTSSSTKSSSSTQPSLTDGTAA